jgi:uncharacterized protein (TIRG00374 family)
MTSSISKPSIGEFKIGRLLKPLRVIIPLAIAGNIIYIVLASKPDTFKKLSDFDPGFLLLAAGLVFMPWLAHSSRMLMWSRAFRRPLKPMQAMKTAIANDIGSAVTPTAIGGGFAKLGFLVNYGFMPGEATLITMLGTLEDGVFFAFSIPSAILFSRAWSNEHVRGGFNNLVGHWPVASLVLIGLLFSLLIVRRTASKNIDVPSRESVSIEDWLVRLRTSLGRYKMEFVSAVVFVIRKGKMTFAINVLIAGAGWCCRYGAISALVYGLGHKADAVLFFLLQWIVFTAMTMIPTPGAVGGAEVSFALVYDGQVPLGIIPTLTGAWRFLTFYLPIIVGAIFLAIAGAGSAARQTEVPDAESVEEKKRKAISP